jgi:chromate transporter
MAVVFAMIGLFCFGGGYGILPFIQGEVINRGWMSAEEFINIIAVSESTPGPLGINVATYVGFKMGGIVGAVFSTVGLMLPAFFLVMLVTKVLQTERGSKLWQRLTVGIRPVVVGLIFYAAYSIAKTVLIHMDMQGLQLDWLGVLLAMIGFVAIHKWKLHPVLLIGTAAVAGAILAPYSTMLI